MRSYTIQTREGRNAVNDNPQAVIEGIEDDLDDALSKLNQAQTTIAVCQNRLAILRERDDIPGGQQ